MGRQAALDSAPPEILAEFNRLVRAGWTIDAIRAEMAALGRPMSNGAAGRAVKKAREQIARYRESQEVAGHWVAELGENPRGDVGAMLAELLKVIAHNTLGTMLGGEDGPAKPAKAMDIMLLAKSIQSLESSAKASMERRERIERAVLAKQAKAAEVTARAAGVADDAWAKIRAEFLGIKDEAS
jgi:hypothetical protein